ncbi:MAG TPA: HD domain-containing protein [Bacillota bacterium]|nr:HD domain-containing protein [Bacillota bacterium]
MALVKEIKEEGAVSGRFLVTDLQHKTAKNGSAFIAMRIGDRSGEIPMKIWDIRSDSLPGLSVGRVVELRDAGVRSFNGALQIEIDGRSLRNLILLNDEEVAFDDFLPSSPMESSRLWNIFDQAVAEVTNPALASLLKEFFGDPSLRSAFGRTPAALKRHHVYVGGLLEHTAGVLNLSLAAASYYPFIDKDLLITGAIFHDIGKIRTYHVGRSFEGTDEGRLIGHLVLGTQMVSELIRRLRERGETFPVQLEEMLLHLLISHHGIMEWGSPVEPLLIEACILHHADNFDAQVNKFQEILRNHGSDEEGWSPFDANLGRSIFMGKIRQEEEKILEGAE